MDIEEENSEEAQDNINESSEEEDEIKPNEVALYNSNYKTEINCLERHNDLFYSPNICPNCNKDSIRTNKFKSKYILQSIGLQCINKKCKKRLSYRNLSFFKLYPKIPCSIIYEILKLSLFEK